MKNNSKRDYPHYKFQDQDPAIKIICKLIAISNQSVAMVADRSGVSTTTIYHWQNGTTRCALHSTLAAVAGSLHHEWRLARSH